jgi:hypothetical protein
LQLNGKIQTISYYKIVHIEYYLRVKAGVQVDFESAETFLICRGEFGGEGISAKIESS